MRKIVLAAYTIVIAVISNTLVKAGMATFMGAPAMRRTIVLVTLNLVHWGSGRDLDRMIDLLIYEPRNVRAASL